MMDAFACLPVAAVIDVRIFAVSGNLSPDLNSLEQTYRIACCHRCIALLALLSTLANNHDRFWTPVYCPDLLGHDPGNGLSGWSKIRNPIDV